MGFSAIYKQWGHIVKDFEEGAKAQQEFIASKSLEGSEMNDYDAGWLFFWESGLAQAKACQQTLRFSYLRKPLPNPNYLLIGFLIQFRFELEQNFPADTSYRSGIMDALEGSMEWVMNDTMQ